ncbi:hypothetical protein [Oceanihabitans sediminis]|uniref:hypothetical protein n=1 Tax=Oceanihabitans sediminis TaxID=1812012 RepID=UPI00299DEA76|nr:hypothetical protein [Oceanihabitans sediminis]MDX1279462.1 hypothetical protein [Oceanihabitans sediminis]
MKEPLEIKVTKWNAKEKRVECISDTTTNYFTRDELKIREKEFKANYTPQKQFYIENNTILDENKNPLLTYEDGIPRIWYKKKNVKVI